MPLVQSEAILFFHQFLFRAASTPSTSDVNTIWLSSAPCGSNLLVLNFRDLQCPSLVSKLCSSHSFEIHVTCFFETPRSVIALVSVLNVDRSLQIDLCCKQWDVPLPCLFCCHQDADGMVRILPVPSSSAKDTLPIFSLL